MIGTKYSFINVQESVVQLMDGFVYVCDNEKVAQLKCPCGCGDIIYLPMIEGDRPQWKVNGNSISPSINRQVGCRSHFTITNGIVNQG
jgi:hypothetical protein